MIQQRRVLRTVGMTNDQAERFSGLEIVQAGDREQIVLTDPFVILRVVERQGEHALFFEVRFVYTRKTLDDDRATAEETRFHRRVFTAGSLAVVFVPDGYPRNALGFVIPCVFGKRFDLAVEDVFALPGFMPERVDGAEKHIVGDMIEMASEFQPRTSRGNVIRRAFAFGFDENDGIDDILAVPRFERLESLKALTLRIDEHFDGGTIDGRRHISAVTRGKPGRR